MATKRTTKTTKNTRTTKKAAKKTRPVYDYDIKVVRAFDGKYGVLCDLSINNVTIYGCRVCATKEGEAFIGFPQKKDRKDPEKWWSIVYAPLTDEQTSDVLEQVENLLAEDEEEEEDEEEDEE